MSQEREDLLEEGDVMYRITTNSKPYISLVIINKHNVEVSAMVNKFTPIISYGITNNMKKLKGYGAINFTEISEENNSSNNVKNTNINEDIASVRESLVINKSNSDDVIIDSSDTIPDNNQEVSEELPSKRGRRKRKEVNE